MDELLKACAQQAPALGVLTFLTIAFLRHLARRDDQLNTTMQKVGDAIVDHAEQSGQVASVLDRVSRRLDEEERRSGRPK